ncbi:nucleoside-diphosphate sugar epimerase/dehydratase [Neisseria leonii]|uniref:Nucleoside-diphosphate sugar epimerase/dehydratase n=1 Tax=Neisseria leonii TaxID=2995413 RepID=A0A9X4E2B2_9NEIS|nr:nucleoside-diphosphate sugar epimerase/dehydratase [Neisseria sp. 51.81]MDD9328280.1 polysaccharide biosynthesis protein [Neisseria sp. 51.81]
MTPDFLLRLPRPLKKLIFVCLDGVLIFTAFWFTVSLKADYQNEWFDPANWKALAATALPTIAVFVRTGLYRAVIRYAGPRLFAAVLCGSAASMLFFFFSILFFEEQLRLALPVVFFLLMTVSVSASRIAVRLLLADMRNSGTPVIIYGAGQSGRQLLEAVNQLNEYRAAAFVDDNAQLWGTTVHDVAVYPPEAVGRLITRFQIRKILLAIPSADGATRREILEKLAPHSCEVLSIPGMLDLMEGRADIAALKKIAPEDLLGRAPVAPQENLMRQDISGKTVMVTGAGGSIGAELCRQIIARRPARLLLFELSEFALYTIDQELRRHQTEHGGQTEILPFLGSVQQRGRLLDLMRTFRVDTVYHAAAYKHVPMVEMNTVEGVRNNLFGTLFCAQAAQAAGVSRFVLISTDKAVRPTNVMGASKRMAELVLQAMAAEAQQPTCFSMVRFGNVLGSSGSVVPAFEQQIAAGGPVTLTHPDITRYFMTIPEAAQLVIQAGAMAKGGDVFVLDMGASVKIMDLAKQMIRLSGLRVKDETCPDGDIEIRISGLRPGEKLYEELLIGDTAAPTGHPRILTADETMLPWPQLARLLEDIDAACKRGDPSALRRLLAEAPTGFVPNGPPCDLLHRPQPPSNPV